MGHGYDFFEDADCGVRCARCDAAHEWVRPGKTQPTCGCDTTCWAHDAPVRFEYRGEDHPVNVASAKIGYGMGLGYHCPQCEIDNDARILEMATQK